MTHRRSPSDLRSARWFAPDDLRGFGHRSRLMQMGYSSKDWVGRPTIAVINTWSDINPCHAHFSTRVGDVKRGILQSGGFPIELPAMSLSENFVKPTTMLYRNMLAMETEELIRSHPVDGVVLMGGCDKTTPALLMGATSAGVPAIFVPSGPMLRGNWQGKVLGSGSDAWKYWDDRQAGEIGAEKWSQIEAGIARSHGHCMTMGTASTMAAAAETLGMTLPGASSIPAADINHARMCAESGRRIVEMVWEDLTPERILSQGAFDNAVTAMMALGCSTNAVIHLTAMARRAGRKLDLAAFDQASRDVPVLANIRPSGDKYLMEDFFYAGGLPALLNQLSGLLSLDEVTANGRTLGENIGRAETYDQDVIRPLDNPVYREGALAVLRGNLSPDGCIIKPSACDPRLLVHTGPAMVFDDYPSLKRATEDLTLDVTPDHVMILRNAGPQGGPGMPEWGMLPIPKRLLREGVRDMVRISDSRMSGTSYGACILHVSPEAYIGGPLSLVESGDLVSVNVPERSLHLHVENDRLDLRRQALKPPAPRYERGYGHLFARHVMQADKGCDFDFLERSFGEPVPEPVIY